MSYSEALEDAHFCQHPTPLQLEADARRRAFRASIAEQAKIATNPQRALPAPVALPMVVSALPTPPIVKRPYEPLTAQFAAAHELLRQITGITIRDVQKVVAAHYGSTVAEMVGPRREAVVVRPRAIAMYLVKTICTHKSLPEIGRLFGKRDHTTILHSVRKIKRLVAENADLADEVEGLKREILGEPDISPILSQGDDRG